jgi:hypothetical protein
MKSATESLRKAAKSRNFDVLYAFSVSADVLIFVSTLDIYFNPNFTLTNKVIFNVNKN